MPENIIDIGFSNEGELFSSDGILHFPTVFYETPLYRDGVILPDLTAFGRKGLFLYEGDNVEGGSSENSKIKMTLRTADAFKEFPFDAIPAGDFKVMGFKMDLGGILDSDTKLRGFSSRDVMGTGFLIRPWYKMFGAILTHSITFCMATKNLNHVRTGDIQNTWFSSEEFEGNVDNLSFGVTLGIQGGNHSISIFYKNSLSEMRYWDRTSKTWSASHIVNTEYEDGTPINMVNDHRIKFYKFKNISGSTYFKIAVYDENEELVFDCTEILLSELKDSADLYFNCGRFGLRNLETASDFSHWVGLTKFNATALVDEGMVVPSANFPIVFTRTQELSAPYDTWVKSAWNGYKPGSSDVYVKNYTSDDGIVWDASGVESNNGTGNPFVEGNKKTYARSRIRLVSSD